MTDFLTGEKIKRSVFLRYPWLRRLLAGLLAAALAVSAVVMGGQVARVREAAETVQTDAGQPSGSPETESPAAAGAAEGGLEAVRVTAPWDRDALAARAETSRGQTDLTPFAEKLAAANEAIANGDYELGLTLIAEAEALSETPDEQAACLALRGNCQFYLENYTSALDCYAAVLAMEQTTFSVPALCGMIARCRMLLEDYPGVADACTTGLAADPQDENAADLYVLRATAQLYLGNYSAAQSDFQLAIDAGYSDPDTLRQQIDLCSQMLSAGGAAAAPAMDQASYNALTLYAAGQYAQAADAYEALYNSGAGAYTRAQLCSCIAKCDLLLGRYEDAKTWSQRGLDLGDASERATLLSLRGTARMALGDNLNAALDYDSAVAAGYPDAVTLNAQAAACYYFAARYDDAVRTGTAAADGGDAGAGLWLALSHYMLGDYAAAAARLVPALALEQNYCDRSELCRLLSRARLLSGDFSGAAAAATDGLAALESEGATTSEILSEFYALRGAAYQSAGEYAKALSDFSAALSAGYAGVYELQKQSALCAFLLGEYDTAESAARAAMQTAGAYFPGDTKDPEKEYSAPDGELCGWLGLVWFSQERYEIAEQAFALSAASDLPQENVYFYMGVCRFSLDDYAAAADCFTKSIDLGQTAERCVYNRGLCYLQLKQYDAARADLEAAAAQTTDPDVAGEAASLLGSLKSVLY